LTVLAELKNDANANAKVRGLGRIPVYEGLDPASDRGQDAIVASGVKSR